jgi:phenylpyruvate tautomerase PptA (4-oxalocrotonate tautomerase family)
VSFQFQGLIVVMAVLVGLWLISSIVSKFLAQMGLAKTAAPAKPAAPVAAAPVAPAASAPSIHPGLSNEQFVALVSAVASHVLGAPTTVVKFRPMNGNDWTWAVQGRAALQQTL